MQYQVASQCPASHDSSFAKIDNGCRVFFADFIGANWPYLTVYFCATFMLVTDDPFVVAILFKATVMLTGGLLVVSCSSTAAVVKSLQIE